MEGFHGQIQFEVGYVAFVVEATKTVALYRTGHPRRVPSTEAGWLGHFPTR